jgi:hypothetical protein
MLLLRVLAFVLGAAVVVGTLRSAIRTFVLPRSANDPLTHYIFLSMSVLFSPFTSARRPYPAREAAMAMYAPVGLLTLPVVWLFLVMTGYTSLYWAVGVGSVRAAFLVSGSSLLTLGFASVNSLPQQSFVFSEAAIGLILVALLIAYLPTMYGAFSRRELAVTLLEVRAGSPPSAVEMILRFHRLGRMERLGDLWLAWEAWFAELEETHTSLAALAFFRSPQPDHSWVTAAGAILDSATITVSTLDLPHDPQADLCIRAGFLALRHIADFFAIPHNDAPQPGDSISVTRAEYDAAVARFTAAGVPLKADRAQAWRDFVGWRVNYDSVLLAIAGLIKAPPAPWSSDRAVAPRNLWARPGVNRKDD